MGVPEAKDCASDEMSDASLIRSRRGGKSATKEMRKKEKEIPFQKAGSSVNHLRHRHTLALPGLVTFTSSPHPHSPHPTILVHLRFPKPRAGECVCHRPFPTHWYSPRSIESQLSTLPPPFFSPPPRFARSTPVTGC